MGVPRMPEIADHLFPPVTTCFSGPRLEEYQSFAPDRDARAPARAARGRFAKGSSGNPRGRPPGIPNPKRRVPDLMARPLSGEALAALLDRKPHLLRPLAAQFLPPPLPPK